MDVYEMQKVHQGGRAGRFVALCALLVFLCVVMAVYMGHSSAQFHSDAALAWAFLGFLIGGAGLIAAAVKWVFTGRL